ncbi:MAG: hypothetical protein WC822_04925 [Candidatus Paceibacterota bacterium]|jgi:hypothetical protein
MQTILKIVCMWCKTPMGEKDGKGQSGETSSICRNCWDTHFPGTEYPKEDGDE